MIKIERFRTLGRVCFSRFKLYARAPVYRSTVLFYINTCRTQVHRFKTYGTGK